MRETGGRGKRKRRCEWQGLKEWPTMLLQLRVRFVISTKCLRTHPKWAGCHLHDVDVPPVKLPRAATPHASQVRSLPLPRDSSVEGGTNPSTPGRCLAASTADPKAGVRTPTSRPATNRSATPGAVGGSCAMNPPSLPNTQVCWCVTHCGDPIRPQRGSVAASRAGCHVHDVTQATPETCIMCCRQIEQPTLASPPAMNNSHWHNARAMPTMIGRRGLWGCAGATSCELDDEREQNYHGPKDNPRP